MSDRGVHIETRGLIAAVEQELAALPAVAGLAANEAVERFR